MRLNAVLRIGTAVAMLSVSGAQAYETNNFLSGNDLHRNCAVANNTFSGGFVAGVVDAFQTLRAEYDIPISSCIPKGVSVDQMVDVVCKSLKDNPQKRHLSASSLAIVAIAKAFPCSK